MDKHDEILYSNILIRAVEAKLAMAERRKQDTIWVSCDVMKDILKIMNSQCPYWDKQIGVCNADTNVNV